MGRKATKFWNSKTRAEKLIYLAVCTQRDREILTLQRDMHPEDLDRIMGMLSKLEFRDYMMYLQDEYFDMVKENLRKMQEQDSSEFLPSYLEAEDRAIEEFCEELPNGVQKTYFGELFGWSGTE